MPPVLLVEDRESLRNMLRSTLEAEGFQVEAVADGAEAIQALGGGRYLAVITDLKLPGADGHEVLAAAREADSSVPVIVMTAFGTVEDAVGAMKQGAFDFLAKPVDPDHLLLLLRRAVQRRALEDENLLLKQEFAERLGFPRIIGEAPVLAEATARLQKAAITDATILLEGESGTGKELFARAAHHLSGRKSGPFVAINCAAIPETLLESELFGHERGAFTGAVSRQSGRIELADGGTLFLDEIGELGGGAQAKLLRVLQERSFERVGGNRTLTVDIRIVAATNRDLRQAISQGVFREDLYYRLAVVTLCVPPLRERAGDVAALAEHFLGRFRRELGREELAFTADALQALSRHSWPGNVRELENCIERAAILTDTPAIDAGQLALGAAEDHPGDLAGFMRTVGRGGTLDEISTRARDVAEREVIRRALDETGGNKSKAADLLEVGYKRLLGRIRELGLNDGAR